MRWRLTILALLLGPIVLGLAPNSAAPAAPDDLTVAMVPPDGDGGKYWPRWRGPSGQNVVPDGNYPDTWSDSTNVRWKIKVPGNGNSSPIIWKDRIYLTTAYDSGKKRAILCLERVDS